MKRREIFDPATTSLVRDLDEMSRLRKLPKRARDAAINRRNRNEERIRKERERQAARVRMTADIPPDVYDFFADFANKHSVPASGLVSLALYRLFSDIQAGLDIDAYKAPSKSPRFSFVIEVPKIEGDI